MHGSHFFTDLDVSNGTRERGSEILRSEVNEMGVTMCKDVFCAPEVSLRITEGVNLPLLRRDARERLSPLLPESICSRAQVASHTDGKSDLGH